MRNTMTMSDTKLDAASGKPEEGVGLALSGGGYRAMVFHVGALIRLNEVGLLSRLNRISSVSGGSITAGALALTWSKLKFQNGIAQNMAPFVDLVRTMADRTVDAGAVVGGILFPGSISDRVAAAYDATLFRGATLQDLPDEAPGTPRFVINATNVQSSVLWRFSKPYMGDHRVGLFANPDVKLAAAVAASSAFPPILSPMTLPLSGKPDVPGKDLQGKPFTTRVVLSDGGVYDNLGLETISKRYTTLLVSDAGQKIAPEDDPHHDWARHAVRILDIVDNQVRSLRKRHLIDDYETGRHSGTYWGIRTQFEDYRVEDTLGCAAKNASPLAEIATRLEAMSRAEQDRLMNWGYAISDAALRKHIPASLQTKLGITIGKTTTFPFAGGY